jgi:hypothetical protein
MTENYEILSTEYSVPENELQLYDNMSQLYRGIRFDTTESRLHACTSMQLMLLAAGRFTCIGVIPKALAAYPYATLLMAHR